MRRVRGDNQLSAIPAGSLIELCQDNGKSTSNNVAEQYLPAELLIGGAPEGVTATADGSGTAVISAEASIIEVTSDDATKQIALPAAVDGKVLRIHVAATGS